MIRNAISGQAKPEVNFILLAYSWPKIPVWFGLVLAQGVIFSMLVGLAPSPSPSLGMEGVVMGVAVGGRERRIREGEGLGKGGRELLLTSVLIEERREPGWGRGGLERRKDRG